MFPIVDEATLPHLSPSAFLHGAIDDGLDDMFRTTMRRVYFPLRDLGVPPYDLWRNSTAAYHHAALLRRKLGNLGHLTALEIGSGNGMKSLGWSALFRRYIGIELDEARMQAAESWRRRFGMTNLEFHHANAAAFIDRLHDYDIDRVDVLILYAVLEHLTIAERREILALAHRVYADGGVVLIDECPNRLSRFDSHSFHLPFVQWLPPEMMLAYIEQHSNRDDLKDIIARSTTPSVSLFRAGVGVSFHEFDLFWPAFPEVVVGGDGYDMEMMNLNPLVADDVSLLDYFRDAKLGQHRLFTKHLISGLFGRTLKPVGTTADHVGVMPHYRGGRSHHGHSNWLGDVILSATQGERIEFPPHQGRLLLTLGPLPDGELRIHAGTGAWVTSFDLGWLRRARLPIWHDRTTLQLPQLPDGAVLSLHGSGDAVLQVVDATVQA